MKERPILFSAEMVRAILENRKTQTRRVVQPFPLHDSWGRWNGMPRERQRPCPYGQPGDGLWCKETFWHHRECRHPFEHGACVRYEPFEGYEKKSPLFMPRWASRITLEITGVRAERIQDITADDCMAEGIDPSDVSGIGSDHALIKAYRELWDSLNANRGYGWDANPFCWVVSFKRVEGVKP